MNGERAVSSAISYTLVVAITLMLTTGLVFGTEALIDDQRKNAAREQVEVVGQQLAATIATVDQFNETKAEPDAASVVRRFPARVAGSQYQVAITAEDADRGRYAVHLETTDFRVNVTVPVRMTYADLGETRVNGGALRVGYDPGTDSVEVENA